MIMKRHFQFLMTMVFRCITKAHHIHVLWIIIFVIGWWSGKQIWILYSTSFQQLQSSCIHVLLFVKIWKWVLSCNEASSKIPFEKELNNYEQVKSVANAYINKRECRIQECVYHTLPGQWLRKTFPDVIFTNSNIPEKRVRLCLAEHGISELQEDSKI